LKALVRILKGEDEEKIDVSPVSAEISKSLVRGEMFYGGTRAD